MVLDIRLIGLAAVIAGCAPGAATAPGPDNRAMAEPKVPLDSARVGGRDLALVTEDGECALDLDGTYHRLGFATPCRFLRIGASAPPTTHAYGDLGSVVLIGGPPAPDADYAIDVGRMPADRCSNSGRAVIVSGRRVALGDLKTSPIWACPESAPDEKLYHGIALEMPFAKRTPIG